MELSDWNIFVNDHHVADPKRTDICRKQMCETVFINVCADWTPPGQSSAAAQRPSSAAPTAKDKNAGGGKPLTPRGFFLERRAASRVAWVETLVRVAILKYLRSSSRYKGPRGALEGLVQNHLTPHMRKEVHCILDTNRWRTDRMYMLEVGTAIPIREHAAQLLSEGRCGCGSSWSSHASHRLGAPSDKPWSSVGPQYGWRHASLARSMHHPPPRVAVC